MDEVDACMARFVAGMIAIPCMLHVFSKADSGRRNEVAPLLDSITKMSGAYMGMLHGHEFRFCDEVIAEVMKGIGIPSLDEWRKEDVAVQE